MPTKKSLQGQISYRNRGSVRRRWWVVGVSIATTILVAVLLTIWLASPERRKAYVEEINENAAVPKPVAEKPITVTPKPSSPPSQKLLPKIDGFNYDVKQLAQSEPLPELPLVIRFSPDGRTLAVSGVEGYVALWNVAPLRKLAELKGYRGRVYGLAFDPDGKTLATSSESEQVKLWNVATGEVIHTLPDLVRPTRNLTFSRDGRYLVMAGTYETADKGEAELVFWDRFERRINRTWATITATVECLAFSPDGEILAAGGPSHPVVLLETASCKTRCELENGRTWDLAFSPDGRLLATAIGTEIKLWNAESGILVGTLFPKHGGLADIDFSADGRVVAAAGSTPEMKLWDVTARQVLGVVTGHSKNVRCVAFRGDGFTFATGSFDKTIRLWSLPAVLAPSKNKNPAPVVTPKPKPKPKPPPGIPKDKYITNSIGMKLVLIPSGKFTMGSPKNEKYRIFWEGPQHEVHITKPFYMGVYEVTQAQYQQVMGTNPSYFSSVGGGKDKIADLDTSNFPVEQVRWTDAVEFCKTLSSLSKERAVGRTYRLPSEAEWEYACRAGAASYQVFHFGNTLSIEQANVATDYPNKTQKGLARTANVGSYKQNGFGLYDMHGNVFELCADCFSKEYYSNSPLHDPICLEDESHRRKRVIRGGGCLSSIGSNRAAQRWYLPFGYAHREVGFRVVCVVSGK